LLFNTTIEKANVATIKPKSTSAHLISPSDKLLIGSFLGNVLDSKYILIEQDLDLILYDILMNNHDFNNNRLQDLVIGGLLSSKRIMEFLQFSNVPADYRKCLLEIVSNLEFSSLTCFKQCGNISIELNNQNRKWSVNWFDLLSSDTIRQIDYFDGIKRIEINDSMLLPSSLRRANTFDEKFNEIQISLIKTGNIPATEPLLYWLKFFLTHLPTVNNALTIAFLEISTYSKYFIDENPILVALILNHFTDLIFTMNKDSRMTSKESQ
jgi:hypothetical protein